jgi:hypothetical protein
MSDHAWVLENLASFVAGGLDPEEREQLEGHTAGCPACARALAEAWALDTRLDALFAGERPSSALEDRSIQRLRRQPDWYGRRRLSRKVKAVLMAAAVLLVGVVGAGLSALIDQERLGFPGAVAAVSENNLKQLAPGIQMASSSTYDDRSYFGVLRTQAEGSLKDAGAVARQFRERAEADLDNGRQTPEGKRRVDVLDDTSSMGDQNGTLGNDWGAADGSVARIPAGTSNTLAYSPDGRRLAAGKGGEGKSHLWFDAATGETRKGLDYFKPGDAWGHLPDLSKARDAGGDVKNLKDIDKANSDYSPPVGMTAGFGLGNRGFRQNQGEDKKYTYTSQTKPPQPQPAPGGPRKLIIRSGQMDFEVDSFDAAVATITRLVNATKGGYVDTVNSEKLPNGKVRGAVVVRVPPDQLDRLILDLRKELGKAGELKGQRIASEDISKKYTDMESRLRAARTMEERLLKIIRDGKGAIKDLVLAETELGKWRTTIEQLEGDLRYYANLVALSTLTINLGEKEIRAAAVVADNERVQAGIEVEDVDGALRQAREAIDEAKGRITKSELKQHAAGQFSADLQFEVAPESAGPLRDRLRQLGTMTRLEIDRVQHAEGGPAALKDGSKVKRGPTQFFVRLYNLANVQPRETQTLKLAAADVAAAYQQLRNALAKAGANVSTDQLNEQDRQNITAHLDFDVRRAQEGPLQAALAAAGDVLVRQVGRVKEGENITDAKVAYRVELVPADTISPRETVKLAVEVADVDGTVSVFTAQVKQAGGRVVQPATVSHELNGRVTGRVVFAVPLAAASGVTEQLKRAGVVRLEQVTPHKQAPEGKLAVAYLDVTLSNTDLLVPRDEGLWAQVRSGLSFSLRGLSVSASWLIVGVLFVLPWVLLIAAVVWVLRRLFGGEATPAPVEPVPAPAAPSGGPAAAGG